MRSLLFCVMLSLSGLAMAQTSPLFIVHFTKGAAWDESKPPNEQVGMREHSINLARLRSEGKLITGARYKDSHADKGMIILRASDRAEVEAELLSDAMVADKRLIADIAEFNPFYEGFIARPMRPAAATNAANPQTKPLAQFAWLAGCWEGRQGSVSFREHWMGEAGGAMFAMARTLRNNKLFNYESIRLELDVDGTTPVYIAKPSAQAEVRFKLATEVGNKFVFENPLNDFPHRIIYQRLADGSLLARIEGDKKDKDGKLRAVDFPMKRSNCD